MLVLLLQKSTFILITVLNVRKAYMLHSAISLKYFATFFAPHPNYLLTFACLTKSSVARSFLFFVASGTFVQFIHYILGFLYTVLVSYHIFYNTY